MSNNRVTSLLTRARTYAAAYGLRALLHESWSRAARRVSRSKVPNRFHVEVSNTCNFSCEYCVLKQHSAGDKVMSSATFDRILPFLRGASSVSMSGLAEPLMNRRFTSMLKDIREVAPHALIGIDTNASLLTEDIARELVDAKLGWLVFSLDGTESSLVDSIRKGGSLESIIANIRTLNRVKREMGSKLPTLSATMVLQRKNAAQLAAVVELAAELEVGTVTVNGLEPYAPELVDDAIWVDPHGAVELRHHVAHAAERARALGVDLRLPSLRPKPPRCPQTGRPVVLADGTVVPCSVLAYRRDGYATLDASGSLHLEHTSTDRVTFGNINSTAFDEIWMAEPYQTFRTAVERGDFPSACAACNMRFDVICPSEGVTPETFIAQLTDRH